MGNKLNSNVADAVKAQAAGETPIYQFINLKGGGDLVDLMKAALRNNNYTEVDNRIRENFLPFLLNGGNGQFVPIGDIVSERCKGKKVEVSKNHEVSELENVTEDSDVSSTGMYEILFSDWWFDSYV